ncbi:MAG: hypothetical protein BRC49_13705 [Cyanobacteria bacterium SW_10_48_33]|nr:MAG: hypothetical protein BRC42_08830 [Cyanobacteria bacterium QS_1_48_34]PSO78711.1 MAG: hypothetical protein BRC45_16880 [Cyanobacteria bacterium QS_5_48_63]PSO89843.1 MAG: hypothetical protein BRC43_03645 [Cyanobacteria bacterium QS_3_48_167]PSO90643.1 MAG: hypothetical protein BRC46_13040 [Cyanobacteria bacterium QS_6_48_18]PSP09202.1 MAG: hypothetical protein BRC49_13705 [Cyanobacteria bacterium SW_10_48_33]PSP22481.1 MAG: hypothetical protein BRC55_12390 [Cyanobacteria bacterium SW_8_
MQSTLQNKAKDKKLKASRKANGAHAKGESFFIPPFALCFLPSTFIKEVFLILLYINFTIVLEYKCLE